MITEQFIAKINKKVFIVSSTPRKSGNSEILANEFARGAKEDGKSIIIQFGR